MNKSVMQYFIWNVIFKLQNIIIFAQHFHRHRRKLCYVKLSVKLTYFFRSLSFTLFTTFAILCACQILQFTFTPTSSTRCTTELY